jgi:hypothetical protein
VGELVDHVETMALFAAAAVNLPNSKSHDSAAAVVYELPRNSCKLDQLPTTTALMSTAANLHQAPGAAAAASATRFSGTLLDVMKCSGTRKRVLIMVVIWFNCATVYYGIKSQRRQHRRRLVSKRLHQRLGGDSCIRHHSFASTKTWQTEPARRIHALAWRLLYHGKLTLCP